MTDIAKLTKAQIAKLKTVPDEWAEVPMFGDTRSIGPLARLGMTENRKIDVTPDNWGSGMIRCVRNEWRITDAGRAALQQAPE